MVGVLASQERGPLPSIENPPEITQAGPMVKILNRAHEAAPN